MSSDPQGGREAPESSPAAEPAPSRLRARVSQARAAWRGVKLPDDVFIAHLASKLEVEPSAVTVEALDRLRVPELFLACACARQDQVAIAHFENCYFSEIDAAWARFQALPLTLDDVRQRLREKLFLHDPPAVAGYAGQGDLGGWLRAVALHLLVNISTRESRERPTDHEFFEAVMEAASSSESAYLKQACRAEFLESFDAAMGRLPNRDKVLLRYAFADRLTVDQIGAVFRVHRATAARWVAKARIRLVRETRSSLMTRLELSEREAASLVRAALSNVGTTLLRRFK